MNEETENFIKELEELYANLVVRAKSYYKLDEKSDAAIELHKHAHNIADIIKRWKEIG